MTLQLPPQKHQEEARQLTGDHRVEYEKAKKFKVADLPLLKTRGTDVPVRALCCEEGVNQARDGISGCKALIGEGEFL